jgi:hypothetical protein
MKRLILFVLLLSACKSDEKPKPYWTRCTDLTWLTTLQKNMASSGMKGDIRAYRDHGEIFFVVNPCTQDCNDMGATVHDCSGKIVCTMGGFTGKNTCTYTDGPLDDVLVWKN